MNLYTIYDKGLGNTDVYARIYNGTQWWDFTTLSWSNTEASTCHLFLTEFSDAALDQSWYYGAFTGPAGGPYPVEIRSTSLALTIGNDMTWASAQTVTQGTLRCSGIITAVARQLQDITNIAWPAPILMIYLNYAVQEIINLKPEANPVVSVVQMVAGTRQTIPSGWNLLVDVKRNMGIDGATPGRAITQIPKQTMDQALPDWHRWDAAAEVRHMIVDDRDPYSFDVFPPQPVGTTQKVELIGSAYPGKVANAATDIFPLMNDYEVLAVDYIVYRALNEATTIPGALNKATAMLNKFYQSLGVKMKAETKVQAEGQ